MRHVCLTCDDLEAAGLWDTAQCCDSCHCDADEGSSEILACSPAPRGDRYDECVTLLYCCRAGDLDLTRTVFAKALLAYRAAL